MPCVRSRIGSRSGCAIRHRLLARAGAACTDARSSPGSAPAGSAPPARRCRTGDRACVCRIELICARLSIWNVPIVSPREMRSYVFGSSRRQRVHLRPRARAQLDRVERDAHHRQRAESEEVELRHADHVEIVLVELDDRPPHRRLLDRQVVAERLRREHEAADVRRAQPRAVPRTPAIAVSSACPRWSLDVELRRASATLLHVASTAVGRLVRSARASRSRIASSAG